MRPARTPSAMTMVGAVLAATGILPVASALAADPTPTSTPSPTTTTAPAPLVDPQGATPTTERDVIGGPLLAQTGPVADRSGGAAALPDVKARAWVLADATTGEVLAARNAHKLRRPASTLKTLTALTLLPRLDPESVWVGTAKAQNTYGSKVGIRAGRQYTIDQLFYGLMLPSGNDAAIALAQANSSVKKTVDEMNQVAEGLQAFNTTVKNPSGLDAPGQFSTAYDLTLIARAALERPDFRRYAGSKTAEFPNPGKKRKKPITIYNQNDLLMQGYDGTVGVKTGFTSKAGRTFIGAAERDGTLLIVTLLGIREPSDDAARKLLSWGFKNRERIVPVGELVTAADVEVTGRSSTAEPAPVATPAPSPAATVTITDAPTSPTFASLSPTAWGWLTIFTAAALVALVAVLRRLFIRRRRRFAG